MCVRVCACAPQRRKLQHGGEKTCGDKQQICFFRVKNMNHILWVIVPIIYQTFFFILCGLWDAADCRYFAYLTKLLLLKSVLSKRSFISITTEWNLKVELHYEQTAGPFIIVTLSLTQCNRFFSGVQIALYGWIFPGGFLCISRGWIMHSPGLVLK